MRDRELILGSPIDAVSWPDALQRISTWATACESRYVCICNVHSVVTAAGDPQFAQVIRGADMATPDGAPIAWMLRRLGHARQQRINGPDLMLRYMELAESRGEGVFLYGGTELTLHQLQIELLVDFPRLRIVGAISPPFRPASVAEDESIVAQINASGARTLWVSLGCPKQEKWMAEHAGRIQAVMLGVGAAFDYHAGIIRRAPPWMQQSGLEWFHRLLSEPRRLTQRYVHTNSIFVFKALGQLIRRSRTSGK